jgi:hypothetical protein
MRKPVKPDSLRYHTKALIERSDTLNCSLALSLGYTPFNQTIHQENPWKPIGYYWRTRLKIKAVLEPTN